MLGKMLGLGRNEKYDRAIRLFDHGLFEEAVAAFGEALRVAEKDMITSRLALFYTAESHANLGHSALSRGAWERAAEHFEKALAIHPSYADLHFSLAVARRRQVRFEDAINEFDAALRINPNFAKAHFHRGLTLFQAGRCDEGMQAITTAVELEPGFACEALDRGLAAHGAGDVQGAIEAFERVSVTEVDDILFHFRLGDDLYRRGLYDQAVLELQKALDLNPRYADIQNHLGLALSAGGRHEEAVAAHRRALDVNPKFMDARMHLAVALKTLGRNDEALEAFNAVLENDSDNSLARQNAEALQVSARM